MPDEKTLLKKLAQTLNQSKIQKQEENSGQPNEKEQGQDEYAPIPLSIVKTETKESDSSQKQ